MRISTCLIFVVSLTVTVGGCSRWRGMNRRDYAMSDPFLESGEALADGTAAGPSAGVVKLGGPASLTGTRAPEKQAIIASYEQRLAERERQKAATAPPGGSPTFPGVNPSTAGSGLPRTGGPSLADFVGKTGGGSSPVGVKTAAVPSTSLGKPGAAATPTQSAVDELADFGQFLEKQAAGTSRRTAGALAANTRGAGSTASASLTTEENDFAVWAKEWDQEVSNTATQANHTVQNSRGRVTQAAQAIERSMEDFTPTLPAPSIDDEFATPLIQQVTNPWASAATTPQPAGRPATVAAIPQRAVAAPATRQPLIQPRPQQTPAIASAAAAAPSQPATPTFADEPNPFAALDAAMDSARQNRPAAPAPAAATAPPKTLDATFDFDSGWRPSHLTRP